MTELRYWLEDFPWGLPALLLSAFLLAWGTGWLLAVAVSLRPPRVVAPLVVSGFVTGWFLSEAPLWQLLSLWTGAGLMILGGALRDDLGWWGLSACVLASLGLLFHLRHALGVPRLAEEALRAGLGEDYARRLPEGFDPTAGFPRLRLYLFLLLYDRQVRVLRNIPYVEGGGRRQMLDIYLPPGEVKKAPVLFQIHGGAWFTGYKAQQARPLMHMLAARGYVCVAINYRLSPRHRWPAHLLDAKRALIWTKLHIAEHGGDPERILVTGGSAGGQLSALLALTANRPELQEGFEHVDTRVQAAVTLYGVYDVLDRDARKPWPVLTRWFARVVAQVPVARAPELFDLASPVVQVHEGAPPVFVIHGTRDNMAPVAQARRFVDRLREVSAEPVVFLELPYVHHMFETFYSLRTLYVLRAIYAFAELTVGDGAGASRPEEERRRSRDGQGVSLDRQG